MRNEPSSAWDIEQTTIDRAIARGRLEHSRAMVAAFRSVLRWIVPGRLIVHRQRTA